jgi:hypothetical protein
MIAHGHFDMPIIGVPKPSWSLNQLRTRAQESLEKHGGVDSRAFAVLSARLQYVRRRLRLTRDIPPVAKSAWCGISSALLPRHISRLVWARG